MPDLEPPRQSLVSNSLYASILDRVANQTVSDDSPGLELSFLPDLFPVRWQVSDLRGQVNDFLSMAPPKKPPRETLWVFSFGMWDVWSMAAFPRRDALLMVDVLAADVFSSVERLYQASLDPQSIAYSETIPDTTAAGRARNDTDAALHYRDSFKILAPTLFDPSLTPAWQLDRPDLPSVHSKSEQMRNAAALTHKWNMAIQNYMDIWVRTPREEVVSDSADFDDIVDDESLAAILNIPASRKRALNWSKSNPPLEVPEGSVKDNVNTIPQRDAVLYDLPQYLLDVIIDRQFREAGISDQVGFGNMPVQHSFLDVAVPCVHDSSILEPESYLTEKEDGDSGDEEMLLTTIIAEEESPAVTKTMHAGRSTVATRHRERDGLTMCVEPDEHLFYTGSTLGQRAIREIGRQVAAMLQNNDTVRASWSSTGKPAKRRSGPPGQWPERTQSSARKSVAGLAVE